VLTPLLLLAAFAPSYASSWCLQTGASRDNVEIQDLRAGATWYSDGTAFGYPQVKISYHEIASGERVGIPGGTRDDLGLLGTWITAVHGVRLTGAAGLDVLQEPTSWRTEAEADWAPGVLWGMRTTAKASSGWIEGWLARKVRATAAEGSVGWDGPLTWAEIGGRVEDRSGGEEPASALPVNLPYNRIESAWAWGTRAWTRWLQAGLSVHWADSRADMHQPTEFVNDTLVWADVPYGSPHDEFGVSGLLKLSAGPVWITTAWPLWSTSRQRFEDPYPASPAYWYSLENAGMAEVKAGWDLVLAQKYVVGLEAKALSLPYTQYAWFTHDAWTQYGLSLTVRFSTP
jgi:hypothetical protein